MPHNSDLYYQTCPPAKLFVCSIFSGLYWYILLNVFLKISESQALISRISSLKCSTRPLWQCAYAKAILLPTVYIPRKNVGTSVKMFLLWQTMQYYIFQLLCQAHLPLLSPALNNLLAVFDAHLFWNLYAFL